MARPACDYENLTLKQLKVELKLRKAKTSGRKAELVERLEAYERNQNFGQQPDIVPDGLNLVLPEASSYLDLKSSTVLPIFDIHALNNYAQLYMTEAREMMYKNRFLRYLKTRKPADSSAYFIRGQVRAEMKKNVAYVVDIVLSAQSEILQVQCECAAGAAPTAHCKHAFVILYALVEFSQTRTFQHEISKTDSLQSFHVPKRYVGSPVKCENIPRNGQNNNELVFDPRPEHYIKSESYPHFFRNQSLNFQGNFRTTPMPVQQLFPSANVVALELDHDYCADILSEKFLKSIGLADMDEAAIQSIEIQTRSQATNRTWYAERRIRLTSSKFGTICKFTDLANKRRFCMDIINPKPFTSKYTSHGNRFESVAITRYEQEFGVSITKCGLMVCQQYPFLASSPDGLVGNDLLIEVKCPYTVRHGKISASTLPFLEEVDGELFLKCNHNYYYQVQGQLWISNRKMCHVVIFTFTEMKVIPVAFDLVFIDQMITKLNDFYNCHFKKAILDRFLYLK